MFLIFSFMICDVVCASAVYQLDDYVYFDPVSDSVCNENNYWTLYNTDTTCYRFIILETNDTANSSTLKVMLDHNVGYDTYDNYQSVLKSGTSNWTRYKGSIDIIDEDTIYEVLNLTAKPTLDNISVNGGTSYPYFAINSLYTINGKESNYYGFWSKDLYEENQNYVYTITEYGNNRLILRSHKRGIRPVITIDKSLLTKINGLTDISTLISTAKEYKYSYSTQEYGGYVYKQLQGFTLTKDKLVFYSSNNSNPDYGLIDTYSGTDYKNLYKRDYGSTGHGNDMTYNSKTNKVLVVGPNSYMDIYEYNGDTLEYEKKYTATDLGYKLYYAIGYDEKHDYYLGLGANRVYILNNSFKQLYSFDVPAIGVYQGIEYYNGYLYLSTFESSCPSSYQKYCLYQPWSSITYVYNVKFNNDGSPTDDFGKLVERLYIGDGIGELESVSFHDNQIYFGYASQQLDSTYAYKFYSFPYDKIAYSIDYNVAYLEDDGIKTITISSDEELKSIPGWTLSNDLHTLSKQFTENTASTSVNVCDLYNNCASVSLKALSFDNTESEDANVDNSSEENNTIDDIDNKDASVDEYVEEDNIIVNPPTGLRFYSPIMLVILGFLFILYNKLNKNILKK